MKDKNAATNVKKLDLEEKKKLIEQIESKK
ncbi:Uncharacterised protein [Klebsiella pneumoniae]|nr:Uncharacterised protein [Klebsiella pneumoniae]SLO08965.1 Uncharacterised protein [Klebsiella pneumoniae]SLO09894.1 Uncharacterised protein [Klebsiella pneumoniae]SLO17703.1 Uncharacterised protein [Klebsiella pneumoniae]SLO22197.1 Uncharacterised protein [Klebsiella pneumoniae]